MVLGPTPEFCLHTLRPLRMPAPIEGLTLACRAMWP
jgi:hypothetical protein